MYKILSNYSPLNLLSPIIWNLNSTKKGQINEEKPQKNKQRHSHKASPIRDGTKEFKIRLETKKKGQKNN